jgi:hypothetical protein
VSAAASDTDPCELERFFIHEETLQAASCQSYLQETGRIAGVSFSRESWVRSA